MLCSVLDFMSAHTSEWSMPSTLFYSLKSMCTDFSVYLLLGAFILLLFYGMLLRLHHYYCLLNSELSLNWAYAYLRIDATRAGSASAAST